MGHSAVKGFLRSFKPFALLTLCLILSPALVLGQGYYGGIVGTATDPSNAAIAGVTIAVTNVQTGESANATTNQMGYYSVSELIPGTYSVSAKNVGFQTLVVQSVKVDVNRVATVNLAMKVGAVTETVQVQATAPLLDTTSGTVGTVVGNQTVTDMPLNGRNFTQLLELVPGTVATGNLFMAAGGSNYSVSGMSDAQNNFTLDGVYNNEEFFGQFGVQPVIDSIQEFKVQTNITSAEFGRGAGANVAVATKSGTNDFHGSAWDFLRNDVLDAQPWFTTYFGGPNAPRSGYRQNQFGFTAGGPVYIPHLINGKNKAFWFFDYEGIRFSQDAVQPATIPTQAMLGGDLSILCTSGFTGGVCNDRAATPTAPTGTTCPSGSAVSANCMVADQIYDPSTTNCSGATCTRSPFANNLIPTGSLNPITTGYASIFYPSVTTAGANNFSRSLPDTLNSYQWNTRGDINLSNSLHLLGRFTDQRVKQDQPSPLPAETNFPVDRFINAEIGLTWLLSSTTFLDFKTSYNRTNLSQCDNNPAPGVASFLSGTPIQGIEIVDPVCPLYPQLSLSGYSGPSQGGAFFLTNMYQQQASLSMQRGRHSMKLGFELDHMSAFTNNIGIAGNFSFDQTPTAGFLPGGGIDSSSGNSVASFLLGLPTSGLRNVGQTAAYMLQWQPSVYFQDDIHVSRKLTVNAGLRYEYDQWPYEKYGRLGNYYFDTHSYGWAGENPVTNQPANAPRSLMNPDYLGFAPRLGFAYSMTPKTIIRAGGGVFYEGNYYWVGQGARGQWPYAVSEDFAGTNSTVADAPLATFFPSYVTPNPTSPPNEQHVVPRNNRIPYTYQWNGGVQHELVHNLLLDVSYVGNTSRRLPTIINGNDPAPGPGAVGCTAIGPGCTAIHPRPEEQYAPTLGAVTLNENRGVSNYNSLQAKLDKRFSYGLQFIASYAYSHSLETIGSGNYSHFQAPQNPDCPRCDYGSSAFDRRHIFTLSGIYNIPFGRGLQFGSKMNPVVTGVLGNWEFSFIYHYNSGSPMNIGIPFDNANTGPRSLADRPNYIGGAQMTSPQGPDPTGAAPDSVGFLNPAAFAVAAPFTFGNIGYDTVRQPAFDDLDAGLFKNFPIREGKESIQFRSEFFNLPNSHAFGCINSTFDTAGFGQAGCTQGANRIIQFALKVYW